MASSVQQQQQQQKKNTTRGDPRIKRLLVQREDEEREMAMKKSPAKPAASSFMDEDISDDDKVKSSKREKTKEELKGDSNNNNNNNKKKEEDIDSDSSDSSEEESESDDDSESEESSNSDESEEEEEKKSSGKKKQNGEGVVEEDSSSNNSNSNNDDSTINYQSGNSREGGIPTKQSLRVYTYKFSYYIGSRRSVFKFRKFLLEEGGYYWSVSDICKAAGIKNHNYFYRKTSVGATGHYNILPKVSVTTNLGALYINAAPASAIITLLRGRENVLKRKEIIQYLTLQDGEKEGELYQESKVLVEGAKKNKESMIKRKIEKDGNNHEKQALPKKAKKNSNNCNDSSRNNDNNAFGSDNDTNKRIDTKPISPLSKEAVTLLFNNAIKVSWNTRSVEEKKKFIKCILGLMEPK